MTHQDIIDRIEALGRERSAAFQAEDARIEKERKSLQELCGGLGHLYARDRSGFRSGGQRYCLYCQCAEPVKA